ncbi:protein translocase subunit [Peltigera leucophlebia]|nr:protein translocase subunit [Peltigera leucophlebia]
MDAISNSSDPFSSTSDPKSAIIKQLRQEAALSNARQLIDKLNMHCFEKCVPSPGSRLSNREETCFTQCTEKYMEMWNTVSRQYVTRLQKSHAEGKGQWL